MAHNLFAVRGGLAEASRAASKERVGEGISAAEIVFLLLCGAAAAWASSLLRTGLHIPGNAIIRAVVPMALGFSLAPRRFGGYVMSASALGTAAAMNVAGLIRLDPGAFTSLCLAGPIMDFALAKAQTGWLLYLRLAAAGIVTNMLALGARAAAKVTGLDPGSRPFGEWWSQAIFTYILFGAIAGLIGAVCCFRLNRKETKK